MNSVGFADDVLEEIFLYLPADEIKKCSLVCKQWNAVLSRETFWKKTVHKWERSHFTSHKQTFHRTWNMGELQLLTTSWKQAWKNIHSHSQKKPYIVLDDLRTSLKDRRAFQNYFGARMSAIPVTLFSLTHLSSLSLSANMITSFPSQISKLTNLR
jgi:hypothetical protein